MNKLILILSLFPMTLLGTTFKVKDTKVNYQYTINKDHINFKANLMDISMVRKKCNETLFKAIQYDFKENTKVIHSDEDKKNTYLLVMNDKTFYVPKNSKLGKYIYSIPMRLQKAKKLETLNCK